MNYFITFNGQTVGPMTKEQIYAYPVTPDTPVCTEENQKWTPLYMFPDLMEGLSNPERMQSPAEVNTTGKDKIVCGVLAIVLGTLGAHYFYMGKAGGAIICILLSIITCGLWGILTLIQGVMMLTMTQADFECKYVLSSSTFPLF
ncbi:NINE protein [Duncaniella freteri]|uniref:NINE protein n=1 Tax=Duncaniella freteri TaxID=2530391 RepID=UPI002582AB43|nr:NINE protein [Duncaniella freteri]